jgi:hypothetical protein
VSHKTAKQHAFLSTKYIAIRSAINESERFTNDTPFNSTFSPAKLSTIRATNQTTTQSTNFAAVSTTINTTLSRALRVAYCRTYS